MARLESLQSKKMRLKRALNIILLCNFLDIIYRIVQVVDGHTQVFIQTDGELRYLVDGVSLQMHDSLAAENTSPFSFTDLDDENLSSFNSPILFDPPALDFKMHPVGMPHMEKVVVRNPSSDTSVHLLSISGSTLHFHCSFFVEKVISPGGNTSFDVVFLAREEGPVENNLFIHTSVGSFKYLVTAVGVPNPYRLRPFVGVRMPLNSSYSPLIHMHNPHSSPLQLTEMYTSGGDLHLELPAEEPEAPKYLWEIPPYETKPVMRANFVARIERNHTAYIRIKTNSSKQEYLIIPMEVEVSSAPGIYTPAESMDFGVMRSQDEPKMLSINLLNSGQKHIHIMNVIATPVNEAIEMKFSPIKVPPDTVKSTKVASVTFIPSKAVHQKQCSGKIVIKAKNNQFKLTIPYQVMLLRGSLSYNHSSTRFFVGQARKASGSLTRPLNITNNFNVTLVVYNASLPVEAKPHFKINFSRPMILTPRAAVVLLWLVFRPSIPNLHLTTFLRLHTNVSHFDIPLLCFSGRLQLYLPQTLNQSVLDFGTLSMGEKRTMIYAVINENPVDVNLKHWGSNMTKTYLELVGLEKGNASTLARRYNFSDMTKSLILRPHHYAIFRVGVTAPSEEGVFVGEAFVETQYEVLKVQFTLRTARGSLRADNIVFNNAFPGKISSQNLYIQSSFSHPMTVTYVIPVPEDNRFHFEPVRNSSPVLHPEAKTLVGKVYFDPRKDCHQKCYSSLSTSASAGHQWLSGISLPSDIGDLDKDLYKTFSQRWQKLIDIGEKNMNVTLQLDTSEVRGFLLAAQASLQWPRLIHKCKLSFPVTQVGNLTVKEFVLQNPSSLPVLVQIIQLSTYPNPSAALEMLTTQLKKEGIIVDQTDSNDVFILPDIEDTTSGLDSTATLSKKALEDQFGVQLHKNSIVMLLAPGMKARVHVGFLPKDEMERTSLILIRNNLTIMDALVVQGQGGVGKITFGSKTPGTDSSLMFEMTEKHLKDCNGSRNNKFLQPNYTVRRAFTARNMGELPVYIRGFDINGVPCSGFGFRVLNCQGFELRPNSSRKVDIAFTPDFTLSRVERTLNIHTSLGVGGLVLKYTLIATLPRRMLASCGQSLPRPSWEYIFYYLVVCITVLLVIVVMVMAYFEADSVLKSFSIVTTTLSMGNDCIPEKLASFNLDHVANSVENKQGNKIDTTSSTSSLNLEAKKRYEGSSQRDSSSDALVNGMLHRTQRRGSSKQDPDFDGGPCKDIASVRYENGGKNLRNRSTRNKQDAKSMDGVIEESIDQSKTNKKRKSQSRSWTSFFKDPFSFGSSSETEHKSNAATQTTKGTNTEKNLAKTPEDDETSCFRDWPKHISTEGNSKSRVRQNSPKENSQTVIKSKWKKQTDISSVEEETSSTTTETSNAESDISEKDNRLPDICVVSKPMKTPRNKSKGQDQSAAKSEFGVPSGGRSEIFKDDDDFQISTKSRAHKKIKVPTEVFGGDVLRPSTLELPYKPKPIVVSTVNKEKRLQPDVTKTNKILNRVKPKSRSITTLSDTDSSDLGKESPPPLWDDPRPLTGYDGFFDLAQQTETFVLHNRGSSSNESNPTSSYRPPTYSAAVSGDLGLNKGKSKTLLAGDVGGTSSRFPGPVGQKPAVVSKSSGPGVTNTNTIFPTNMWNSLNGVGSTVVSPHILPERDVPSPGLSSWSSPHLTDKLGCSTGSSCTDLDGILGSDRLPHKEYVRALQIQRYQKMEEYNKLQALQNQTEWSMCVTPISNSLWDPGYTPRTDTWRSVVSSERDVCSLTSQANGQPKTSNCLWSSLVDDNWNTVSSVWSTATDTSPSDPPLDLVNAALSVIEGDEKTTEKSDPPETPTTPAPANNLSTGNFDPFRTLDSIWNPPLTSTETSSSPSSDTWSCFSLFSHSPATAHPEESAKQ